MNLMSAHAISLSMGDADIDTIAQRYFKFLQNEHRGVRNAALECLITMIELRVERTDSKLQNVVKQLVESCITQISVPTVFQRVLGLLNQKFEYICLLAQICTHVKDAQTKKRVISTISNCWNDGNGRVRRVAIDMIEVIIAKTADGRTEDSGSYRWF
jgi:hypothetical protein